MLRTTLALPTRHNALPGTAVTERTSCSGVAGSSVACADIVAQGKAVGTNVPRTLAMEMAGKMLPVKNSVTR